MERRIVECIPNFSESRRAEVVQSIEDSIRAIKGVYLLDRHMDDDHNRSVITFAGDPQAVAEAAFQAVAKAGELIDLDKHSGEHPRIGATDVVPFVPISGVTMEDCIELARSLGKRVGEELGIPVYLYEKAATRPDRVNLANLRKGEYEPIKEAIQSDPDRVPDFGPAKLSKAGATVIGARTPLIAYNVYLTTDDVSVAVRIARRVRHSTGGLRFVKALGMLVDGQAQVSMNLTDYNRTAIETVVESIRREADVFLGAAQGTDLINEAGVPGGRFIQGDYTIANIAFGVVQDAWSAELFIDNVADESAAVYVDTQNFTPKVVTNRPRTVGLRLSYDF